MDKLQDYGIQFKGLSEDRHQFDYDLGESFFALFENSLVERGDVKGKVELIKSSALLTLKFELEGEVETLCDNCLDTLTLPVNYTSKVYVKFGEEYDEPSDEIMVVSHLENEINVAQLLYEFTCIGLPIRHVHPDDEDGNPTCDTDMLGKLDEYLVQEDGDDDESDSRWDELKKLLE